MALLVDAQNWIWRAAFAGRNLSSRGRPTGALHVGLSMLATLPDLFEPQRVVFLWDSRNSWRKKILPEYKANRTGQSEERKAVYPQIDTFREVLGHIGIFQLEVDTLEADDLIGIFTTALVRTGRAVTIVSSDKDFFQLLASPLVTQVRGWKGKKKLDKWDGDRVLKELHIPANKWAEYLALVGDKVDNIPSVRRGMGPVTGVKLFQGAGIKSLPKDEYNTWERNLKVTRVLRSWEESGLPKQCLIRPHRSSAGWEQLEKIMTEYELTQLWGDRRKLWDVGGWSETSCKEVHEVYQL